MRLNELVRSLLPEGGTLVDRTGADHAWPPLVKVSDSAPAEPADDVMTAVTVGAEAGGDELQAALAFAGPGESVLLVLPWLPHELPVGPVVQALVSAGIQAVEAHPIADTAWNVAIVCRRVDDLVQPVPAYLDRRRATEPLAGRALLRFVDEHIVEGLVWRNGEVRDKQTRQALDAAVAGKAETAVERDAYRKERDDLATELDKSREATRLVQAQLAEANARVKALDARLRRISGSRAYRLIRGAAKVARTPGRLMGKRTP